MLFHNLKLLFSVSVLQVTGFVIHNGPRYPQQSKIIFPDEVHAMALSQAIQEPTIKPHCTENAENFCNSVENYPEKFLQRVLRDEKYEQFFGDDQLPNENLTKRFDDYIRVPLCDCVERVIFPQAGITRTNVWSIIINQKNYTQGIRVEECVNSGRPCAMSHEFPLGMRTKCEQKYIYRQLLSLNSKGIVVKDFFRLPSCCMCTIYYDNL